MSYTKALKKRIPTMSIGERQALVACLRLQFEDEKNVMIKSSLRQQIRMLDNSLTALVERGELQKALNS